MVHDQPKCYEWYGCLFTRNSLIYDFYSRNWSNSDPATTTYPRNDQLDHQLTNWYTDKHIARINYQK